jgi:protein disulfide-isomerase A6
MAPEMSKAAIGLNPLIGTYGIDCDDEKNKKLCSQQVSVAHPPVSSGRRPGKGRSQRVFHEIGCQGLPDDQAISTR